MYDLYIFLKLSSDDISVGKIVIQSHTYPFPDHFIRRIMELIEIQIHVQGHGPLVMDLSFMLCFGLWILKEYTTYTVYILKMVTVAVCTRTTPKTLQKNTPRDRIASL